MTIKIKKILELYEAFASLDGYTEIKDGKVSEKTYYYFGGKTKYNLVKNLNVLKRHYENFEKTRDELVKSISGGSDSIKADEPEKLEKFNKELVALLDTEEEVSGLLKVKFEALNLDDEKDKDGKIVRFGNKIPNTTISKIFDFVEAE